MMVGFQFVWFFRYNMFKRSFQGGAYFCGIATPLVMEDFLAKVKVNKFFSMPKRLAKG